MNVIISKDGTPIAYDRSGRGLLLLIVGGALNDHSSAARLASELGSRFSVVSFDRRGRGESGDTPSWSIEHEIEDLRALADLGQEPVFVYGHSSGAILALEATLAGLPARRLIMYEPPYVTDRGDPHAPPDDLADRLRATLAGPGGADAAVREFLRLGPGIPAEAIEATAASPAWERFLALAHTLPFEAEIVGNGMIPRERLEAFTTPTMVCRGGASPTWIRSSAAALVEALPRGTLLEFGGLDHGGARSDPERVAAEVIKFLLSE